MIIPGGKITKVELFECDGKRGTATISAVSFFTTKPPKRTPKRTPCMPAYLPKAGTILHNHPKVVS
jgi:hypothetical protein